MSCGMISIITKVSKRVFFKIFLLQNPKLPLSLSLSLSLTHTHTHKTQTSWWAHNEITKIILKFQTCTDLCPRHLGHNHRLSLSLISQNPSSLGLKASELKSNFEILDCYSHVLNTCWILPQLLYEHSSLDLKISSQTELFSRRYWKTLVQRTWRT